MDMMSGRSSFLLLLAICVLTCLISSSDSSLEYDFYRDSCPEAEQIIRSAVRRFYDQNPRIGPAFLRLVFHDCFIQGCDGSVLLDTTDSMRSEKESPPNQSLKGFHNLDIIKSELENLCPGVVSCADLLVLAARESVLLAGGPFYPLQTGRRDSKLSFYDDSGDLPAPTDSLQRNINKFAQRGFNERETVGLLGAHSTGMIHCEFFQDRLSQPDPTLNPDFLEVLRSRCNNSDSPSASSPSSSPSPSLTSDQEPGMKMDYEGPGSGFGSVYYRSLLQGRGILFVDQQLMAGNRTADFVRQYASDILMFHRDFALAMMKLSSHQVLTGTKGNIRRNCKNVSSRKLFEWAVADKEFLRNLRPTNNTEEDGTVTVTSPLCRLASDDISTSPVVKAMWAPGTLFHVDQAQSRQRFLRSYTFTMTPTQRTKKFLIRRSIAWGKP